ncbi:hypothetical protein HK096_011125 [Nowakowskiella sp. JEL0078]|nr:hypothetical protein HK096_011125 [Nowakowskiella sp. JEL0078]
MNIHRWRKLSGSDPSTYELITKIQTLQKRLISKTEEVVEKELIIQQKERLYKEIKEVLQRQPGPEVMEELRIVKDAVKSKVRECKSLASELNMYHSQVNEYKYEIERLNREYQELKKKYYDRRKRDRDGTNAANYNSKMANSLFMNSKISPDAIGLLDNLPSLIPNSDAFPNHFLKNIHKNDTKPNSSQFQYAAAKTPIKPNSPKGTRFSGGGFNHSTTSHNTHNQYPAQIIESQTATAADFTDTSLPGLPMEDNLTQTEEKIVNAEVIQD